MRVLALFWSEMLQVTPVDAKPALVTVAVNWVLVPLPMVREEGVTATAETAGVSSVKMTAFANGEVLKVFH